MSDYKCYEDEEDLTEKVREKVRGLGGNVVVAVRSAGAAARKPVKPWEIIVECSQGHRNKFSGKGQP